MSSPLLTIPVINAIVFAAYEQGKRMVRSGPGEELTRGQIAMAGGF